MSTKFQLVLPDDLAAEIKQEASRLALPAAELIRESVRERLRRERAHRGRTPLSSIIGLVDGDETDLSSRVDELLYE